MVVLITGCGAPGAPSIIKLLKQENVKIIGVDINPDCAGRYLVDHYVQTGPLRRSAHIFADIRQICQRYHVKVVLPLVTAELRVFAKEKERLKDLCGTIVAVNDFDKIEIVNDKGKLYQFLESVGLPVAKFFIVNTSKECGKAVRAIDESIIYVKPPKGNGSRGCRMVKKFIDISGKPDGQISYLDFFNYHNLNPQEYIVMEYLPGIEYTIDILADHGECLYVIPRKRDVIRGGITYSGTVEKNEEIIAYCKDIIGALDLHGIVGIQVKADKNGQYKILEINPRLQGTTCLSSAAGINLPYWAAMQALGHEVPKNLPINWGLKMYRHYEEVYVNPENENGRNQECSKDYSQHRQSV